MILSILAAVLSSTQPKQPARSIRGPEEAREACKSEPMSGRLALWICLPVAMTGEISGERRVKPKRPFQGTTQR